MPRPFLSYLSVRVTDNPKHFACEASAIGLDRGHFPFMIETDMGNSNPLYLDHPIFDDRSNFLGAVYRQSGGCLVSVFLD